MFEIMSAAGTVMSAAGTVMSAAGAVMLQLVHQAFTLFQRERHESEQMEKTDDMNAFYSTAPNVRHGTTTFIAKAVLETLLDGEINGLAEDRCVLS